MLIRLIRLRVNALLQVIEADGEYRDHAAWVRRSACGNGMQTQNTPARVRVLSQGLLPQLLVGCVGGASIHTYLGRVDKVVEILL